MTTFLLSSGRQSDESDSKCDRISHENQKVSLSSVDKQDMRGTSRKMTHTRIRMWSDKQCLYTNKTEITHEQKYERRTPETKRCTLMTLMVTDKDNIISGKERVLRH